ncbi:hypothetical protein SH1V18_48070 [Vallitalea longa]|uniref:Tubulin-like protein TubZ-like C-terminal domain-containing protein n=1 Tax=Vallitalea longa TaxID=2936439 RepID=A0A9W6DI73_9FIRM|nr:tubulin-like doman-containing protein [Vallitalea longa]GKX32327.1 hypothetical protein SH1V18_48070 [Vallitalea longa]
MKINVKNLGCQNFEGFMGRKEVKLDKLNMSFVAGGQGGGKITSEPVRLGYYGYFYNTCKEDNMNIKSILESLDSVNYKILQLDKYDGASKDREIGKEAIKENVNLLKEKLITDKKIIDSDFTWIVVALGGGTGNGSLNSVSQIVSGMMRKNKRYLGKPTVGIIAAVPEGFAKQKIWLNTAKALQEIKELQKSGLIGACLLIDNEKLMNDYLKKSEDTKDWTTYGNTTVARLLAELDGLISLPGKETFDKSELLDIYSTPGFFSIGKMRISDIEKYKEKYKEKYNELIKDSFVENNLFCDGYDYKTAVHGGMAVLRPSNSKIFTTKDTLRLKMEMSKFLDSPMVEVTHFGIYDNDEYGTYKHSEKKDEALIYTLVSLKDLPSHINKMTKKALEREKAKQEQMKKENTDLEDMLSGIVEPKREKKIELSIEDIFNTKDDRVQKESKKEENAFDQL